MACSQCAADKESLTSASGQERVRYFPRQLLTADDMRTEQEYFREKQRRHNRLLHGSGVVCGLEVVADPSKGPMIVNICPGYALGPCGDEIYVSDAYPLDLTYCARPTPADCTPATLELVGKAEVVAPTLIVKIRYAECPTRPMRTLPAGCGCDETACEYSRVRDGFEIQCVQRRWAKLQPLVAVAATDCLTCPEDPWLVLAGVKNSTNGLQIDNSLRKQLTVAGIIAK